MLKKNLLILIIIISFFVLLSCNTGTEKDYIKICSITDHITDTIFTNLGLDDKYSFLDDATLHNIIYLKLISMNEITDEDIINIINSVIKTVETLSLTNAETINAITSVLLSSIESPQQIQERLQEIKAFLESKGLNLSTESLIAILTGFSLSNKWDYGEIIEELYRILCYLKNAAGLSDEEINELIPFIMEMLSEYGPNGTVSEEIIRIIGSHGYFPFDSGGDPKYWKEPNIDTNDNGIDDDWDNDGDGEPDDFDWDEAKSDYQESELDGGDTDVPEGDTGKEEEEGEGQVPGQPGGITITPVDEDGD